MPTRELFPPDKNSSSFGPSPVTQSVSVLGLCYIRALQHFAKSVDIGLAYHVVGKEVWNARRAV